jgi:hypothetical protein
MSGTQPLPHNTIFAPNSKRWCWGDLLGPAGGEDEELTERTVRDRYLVSVLAPPPLRSCRREASRR